MVYLNSDAFYFGRGWILRMGFILLMLSGLGNWGYSYRAHRRVDGLPSGDAPAILNLRYAAGELSRAQHLQPKSDIAGA